MLGVAVLGRSGSQARAGAIGDAVVAAGGWVAEVEQAVTAWLERVWGRVSAPDRESRAADAFRILIVESPDRVNRLADRAGYALSGYSLSRDGDRNLVLRFRHDRELAPEERRELRSEERRVGKECVSTCKSR